jgi:mono/diheme cytochrome c family protein
VQPGQTLSCVGCHEPRRESAPNRRPLAASREPSPLAPGPPGTWPLRFDQLVQPVLDQHCVKCHRPGGEKKAMAKLDLRPAKAYDALLAYGNLQKHVRHHYLLGRSEIRAAASFHSPLLNHLRKGHQKVKLSAEEFRRLITWLDTYAQRQGHFSPAQEEELRRLRQQHADLLAARGADGVR